MLSLLPLAFTGVAAVVFQLAVLAVGVGLSVLSATLLKPKSKSAPVQLDNEPTAIATRGAVLPYLIGRRRVGAIFAWVGRRIATPSGTIQSSGKSRGGRKTKGFSDQLIYAEEGIHLLCVGPAKKLHRIWQNGKVLWEGPIDSDSTPSGSGFQIPNGTSIPDTIQIYWGEIDQPIDPIVNAAPPLGMGVASRFPLCCYVRWSKRLGPQPRWPLLEYDIETEIQETTLGATPHELIVSDPDVVGVNPAHALAQLLYGSFPYGINQDPDDDLFDGDCLEDLGTALAAEGIPISVFAPNGQDVRATVASIMQDAGILMPWDPVQGKFRFVLVRPEASPIPIAAELLAESLPEIETFAYAKPVDKILFAFADLDHEFKTSTIGLDDDGQAIFQSFQRASQTEMRSIIHFSVGQIVAERRSQEVLARATKYTLTLDRGARRLFPGLVISVPSVTTDLLRLTDVALSPLSRKVQITAVSDFYGAATAAPVSGSAPGGGTTTYDVDEDLAFAILEIPAHVLLGQPQTIAVPRIRATTAMTASEILLSGDDVTYQDEGQETDLQTGGSLTSALTATGVFEVAQGPTFDVLGPDIGVVLDLSSDLTAWRSGRQVVLIGDELFFLKKVTALGGSSYRLDGLIRARYDTDRAVHSVGAKVYIFQSDAIHEVRDALLAPSALVYVKSDPSGLGGVFDAASITAVSKTLIGKGVTPMPVGALRTTDQRSSFRTGENVPIKWAYRSAAIPHTGAGLQGAGSGVGASPIGGSFELKFYTLGAVLKATKTSATASYTYLNADLVTDFGSEQSFVVEVRNINGAWKSAARSLTVELV